MSAALQKWVHGLNPCPRVKPGAGAWTRLVGSCKDDISTYRVLVSSMHALLQTSDVVARQIIMYHGLESFSYKLPWPVGDMHLNSFPFTSECEKFHVTYWQPWLIGDSTYII